MSMTLDEAREYFRLWPRWENRTNGAIVMVRYDGAFIFTNATALYFTGSVEEFLKTYKNVPIDYQVDSPPTPEQITPVGSWWRAPNGELFCVTVLKDHKIKLNWLDGSDGESGFFRTRADFTTYYTRITPENFRWHETGCTVCGRKMHTSGASHWCDKLLAAVWGCASRALQAYDDRKLESLMPAAAVIKGNEVHRQLEEQLSDPHLEQMIGRIMRPGSPPAIRAAAERALRFISGLNLQDHSIKEQREAREVVCELMKALKPEKMKLEITLYETGNKK